MSMPTCPSCIYAHGVCEKTGVKIRYSTGCSYHKPKSLTNYDRIVSKSPGELAEWLAEVLFHCSNTICDQRCPMYECCCDQPSDNIEDWLKQEVTDNSTT